MSYIYSQALVEAFLPGDYSGTDAYVPLSGSLMPRPCLFHDKTMEVSRLSRYGMTCRPSTASFGKALLTWWREGSRAKTSASLEKAQESRESVRDSGPTWRASLAKFDPDTCSWKTVQLSLLGDSELSSVTWPRSGMTADGQCWELPMLGRPISEIGYGFWPTPVASDTTMRSKPYAQGGTPLSLAVTKWPTPTTRDRGTDAPARTGGPSLGVAVRMWPTPTAHNAKEGGFPSEHERNTPTLAAQAGGKLNPTWVEWLMGWPLGWTALKPSETAKSPSAPQPRGESLEGLEA